MTRPPTALDRCATQPPELLERAVRPGALEIDLG
jgi:hypothetical protein